MVKKALVIADVQNDFLPGGALGVPEGDQIIPVLNEYMRRFEEAGQLVILSRDWHPAMTQHFKEYGGRWPIHCIQGTPGAEFGPGLDLPKSAIVLSKGMDPNQDGYSIFDGQGPSGKSLDSVLRKENVTHLYIAGIATDYCVRATAEDALRRGLAVTVLEDAIKGVSVEDSQRALAELKRDGAKLATLPEVAVGTLKELHES